MKKLIKGEKLANRGHKSSYHRHKKRPYNYASMYERLQRDHPGSALARHRRDRGLEG